MSVWWSETMVQGVGWTLLHFLWQGLVIAGLLAGVLRLLRNGPAQYRYLAGCAALFLMALAPLVTFQLVLKPDEPPPLPVVEPAPEFTPAPVERTVAPAMTKPKIVVTATREPRAPKISWRLEPLLPWLVAAWLAGVSGLSCRLFAGWLQVRRLRRADAEVLADGWPEKLAELARRLGVDRPLRLLRTARVEVPTVIGWLRPVILLPAACLAGLTPAQLEAVLAHELAHIRRHDYLINLLQSAVETLLFYHPAVWWVSRRIREERENCCDDLVVEVCGDRVGYARALATLEELRPAPAQLALAAGGAPLLQRIRRLLGQGERSAGRPAWPLAGLLVVALLAVAGLEWRGHRANAAVNNPAAPVVQHKTATATNDPNAELRNILTDVAGAGTNAGTDWVHLDPWGNPYIVTLDKAGERIYLVDSKGHTTTDTNAGNWTLAILDTNTGKWVQEFSNAPVSVQLSSKSTEARVNTLIEDGKFYYEAGQYDEAEARFKLALKLQPDNVAASQYTKLIVEKRADKTVRDNSLGSADAMLQVSQEWNIASRTRQMTPRPNMSNRTNLIYTSKGRQVIQDKLNRIRIDSVNFDLPLLEALDKLTELSRKLDPEGRGINFLLNRQPAAQGNTPAGGGQIDPATGLPMGGRQEDRGELSQVKVNIKLYNVRLADVLDAITKTADRPISYSLEDYGVMFSLRGLGPTFETRTFRVDPNTFIQGLQSRTGGIGGTDAFGGSGGGARGTNGDPTFLTREATTAIIQSAIRQYFTAAGVDLSTNTGKVVIFNARMGTMTIRATPADLDLIEADVQILNSSTAEMRSGDNQTPAALETRTFLVHTNVFREGLESARAFTLTPEGEHVVQPATAATNKNIPVEEQLRELFRKAGVGLDGDSRKVMIWNENRGTLTVRATPEDLDLIEAVVTSLNEALPEVNIKAKFVEITTKEGGPEFQWNLGGFKIGDAATNNSGNPAGTNGPAIFPPGGAAPSVKPNSPVTGILTDPQFRAVLQALDQRDGVDVLTAPEVTTESGRQAQIEAVDIQSIVVNTNTDPLQNTNLSVKEMHFGPTLDVIPYISPDEFSIQMTLIPSVTEFLGYDDPRKFVPPVKHPDGSITVLPLPHFRLRQVVTSVTVWDAQTVVIGGFGPVDSISKTTDKVPVLGGIPLVGGLFRSEHVTKTKKNLLVFITPTIINPDGTRYHKDEDIPFARSSIPPQTATNSTPKK